MYQLSSGYYKFSIYWFKIYCGCLYDIGTSLSDVKSLVPSGDLLLLTFCWSENCCFWSEKFFTSNFRVLNVLVRFVMIILVEDYSATFERTDYVMFPVFGADSCWYFQLLFFILLWLSKWTFLKKLSQLLSFNYFLFTLKSHFSKAMIGVYLHCFFFARVKFISSTLRKIENYSLHFANTARLCNGFA